MRISLSFAGLLFTALLIAPAHAAQPKWQSDHGLYGMSISHVSKTTVVSLLCEYEGREMTLNYRTAYALKATIRSRLAVNWSSEAGQFELPMFNVQITSDGRHDLTGGLAFDDPSKFESFIDLLKNGNTLHIRIGAQEDVIPLKGIAPLVDDMVQQCWSHA